MNLKDFPRPDNDNGLGIHFGQDLRDKSLAEYIPKMVELKFKWCLVPHQDELQLQRAAQQIWSAGILPISRWICRIDQNVLDFVRFVKILDALNVPPYIQIFNEPTDNREWKDGKPKPSMFVKRWVDHAARVADAGGLPGLQALDADEIRLVLHEILARNARNVLERMWFCPHPYGANHPPDYPYDARNQQDNPGATVFTDDITVLGFLTYPPVFQEEIGFVPPFICGEGGWQFRNVEDPRYPALDDAAHARFHAALYDWFRTGQLSNGAPLPDYLFAFCPWIFFGVEKDAWYSWTTGTRQPTIDAVKSIPAFTRKFTWDAGGETGGGGELPAEKILTHYVYFGQASRSAFTALIHARNYFAMFGPAFGFDLNQAARAQVVTIVGDTRAVSAADEAQLKAAGCRVERLLGDAYAVGVILADRVARGKEYG